VHLDVPLTDQRKKLLLSATPDQKDMVHPDQTRIRLPFIEVAFLARQSKNKLLSTPSLDEAKYVFVDWLIGNCPDVLKCQVETYLDSRPAKHRVLWTPPYCPDLQPIELFWAQGKGHAARRYTHGHRVRGAVADLRNGWYGNVYRTADGKKEIRHDKDDEFDIPERKAPVDCAALIRHAVVCANKRIPYVKGLSGIVGEGLVVDAKHKGKKGVKFPIDALLNVALEGVDGNSDNENGDNNKPTSGAPEPLPGFADLGNGIVVPAAAAAGDADEAGDDLVAEEIFAPGRCSSKRPSNAPLSVSHKW